MERWLPIAGRCGTAACDPRSIGVSPVVMAQLALYPAGNNNTLGDGLNSIGFTHDYSTPISTEVGKMKLNYTLNNKWSLLGNVAVRQYFAHWHRADQSVGEPHIRCGRPILF